MKKDGDGMKNAETVSTSDARRLMVFTKDLALHLTKEEFASVLDVYVRAIDRLDAEASV